jgi:RNA polymerase sigma-70 factor (ECF subfamily)
LCRVLAENENHDGHTSPTWKGNTQDAAGSYADSLKSPPQQQSRMEFEEFRVALAKLPSGQREALLLVGASGFSYEEAAAICESAVGTIKSRVYRARTQLSRLLSIDSAGTFGQDHTTRGVPAVGGRGFPSAGFGEGADGAAN